PPSSRARSAVGSLGLSSLGGGVVRRCLLRAGTAVARRRSNRLLRRPPPVAVLGMPRARSRGLDGGDRSRTDPNAPQGALGSGRKGVLGALESTHDHVGTSPWWVPVPWLVLLPWWVPVPW